MFSSTTGCAEIDIPSRWREATKKGGRDASTTTAPITTADRSDQNPVRSDRDTQTERSTASAGSAPYDEKALAEFLHRAIRLLDDEPRAQDAIDGFIQSTASYDQNAVNLAYSIRAGSLPVSRIDWNCSGHVLAVAHGRYDHTGWCRHSAQISIWNLALKVNADRPNRSIPIDSCATALAFHPTRPNLLALGNFTGQLLIVDIAAEGDSDPILARSTTEDLTHREPISALEWVYDAVLNDYLLASIGTDGRILVWNVANKLAYPIAGIRLAPSSLYHGQGVLPNKHQVLGGIAFAFSPAIDGLVVAGTEAGGLVRCQILTPAQYHGRADVRDGALVWSAQAVSIVRHSNELRRQVERAVMLRGLRRVEVTDVWAARPSPNDLYPVTTTLVYKSHAGPVRALAFSRLHRHLFLSAAADGFFRVYHVLRSAPLLSLDVSGTLTDARWSYWRPSVALVADANGVIHVMDLLQTVHGPALSLPMNQTGTSAISVAFNRNDGKFLATGDLDGQVAIWTLSESLHMLQPNENTLFQHWETISDEGYSR